jgi:hypothetical protein
LIKFIIALLAAALGLAAIVFFSVHQNWLEKLPSFFYQTLFFLMFSTAVIYVYLYKVNKPDYFVQLYLLTMAVKLLGYGAYVYFMITGDRKDAFSNVVFFMVSYFLFTTLEIVFLYRENPTKHTD